MAVLKTRSPAPDLEVDLVGGGRWKLSEQANPAYTMVVFYRGLHCPKCKAYLEKLNGLVPSSADKGVGVIAVSTDDAERAEKTKAEWEIDDLTVGHGLSDAAAREWGLFVSEAIREGEYPRFNEPGLFLVDPDGVLYFAAINSNPFGRPDVEEILGMVDFVKERGYPARGEA